jgi:hypothetical protein
MCTSERKIAILGNRFILQIEEERAVAPIPTKLSSNVRNPTPEPLLRITRKLDQHPKPRFQHKKEVGPSAAQRWQNAGKKVRSRVSVAREGPE